MSKVVFTKNKSYNSNLIIIDGFSGSGKILIAELLKAINDTEITKWELSFDYLPILFSLGSIEKEAAKSLLRTIFDEITYNMAIGRELNFRIKDLLSAIGHPKKFAYLKSIFRKEPNDIFFENNVAPRMNIPIIVHLSSFNNYLIEETFGEKLKIFYSLRDPLYILEAYSSYLDRIKNDPREFTPKLLYKDTDLPWYAFKFEEEYCKANNTEKSILIIEKCFELLEKKLNSSKYKQQYKLIFFEDIVTNPDSIFSEIVSFLNLSYKNKILQNIKLKNKIPRANINIVEGFWKRYTTNNTSRDGDNESKILNRTKSIIDDSYYEKLLVLRKKYYNLKKVYDKNLS